MKTLTEFIQLYQESYWQGRQSVPKSGRSEWGGERNFGVAPKNVLLKGYFCPNFRGGAEKVVVHMHWLTWLLWRPCLYQLQLLSLLMTKIKSYVVLPKGITSIYRYILTICNSFCMSNILLLLYAFLSTYYLMLYVASIM